MLLKLTGSSCSGKTTLAAAAAARVSEGLVVHDFDEIGVPSRVPKGWRNHANEAWVRRAIEYESQGLDLLLTGQSPLGEVLATPSALALNGIAVCLIDVEDNLRRERFRERAGSKWSPEQEQALVNWAAWHRGHASDPRHQPDVIINDSENNMRWERWTGWLAGDHRWLPCVIDTSYRSVDSCAGKVVGWVERCRAAHASGLLPLRSGWVDRTD